MAKPRLGARRRWHQAGALRLLTGGVICLGMTPHAAALSIQPTVVERRAEPGVALQGGFHVLNDTAAPLPLRVELEPLGSSGHPAVSPAQWLSVSPEALALPPGQTLEVQYAITVPDEASGELAAMVVFVQDAATGGLQVRFGAAVYVAVIGTEELSLEIGQMRLASGEPSRLDIPIANRGNVHCRPEGDVAVVQADGMVAGRGTLVRGMPALPGREERFMVPLSGGALPPGAYRLEAELTCHSVAELPATLSASQSGELDEAGHWQPTTR